MKETLIIRNFGPIEDATLELRQINIFIGDQGTGKSTVAKLYALIWNFIYFDIFNDEKIENSEDKFSAKFFNYLEKFDLIRYLKERTFIELNTNKFDFIYKNGKVESLDPKKYEFRNDDFERGIHETFQFNYIPAERVFTSILSDALYGLMSLETKMPQLFLRFGNKFQGVRKEREFWDYNSILNASYLHENGKDYVTMKNGERIFLSDSSSGLQGTLPLLIVFDSIVKNINKFGGGKTRLGDVNNEHLLIIEEPELNLFPETQKKLIEHIIGDNFEIPISSIILEDDFENKVFKNKLNITTHSPYTLTTLNNLMYAYQVGQKHKEEVNKIIQEKYWVNPKNVSCYFMENGEAKNIIDIKEGMIKTEFIDSVSSELNKEFDQLIDIEVRDNAS